MPSMRYVCAHTSGICPAGVTAISTKPSRHCGTRTPRGQLHRAWQLRELLRTLLRHPLEQARGELKHWVFWASHSRIPEITELARKIRRRRPDILRTIELGYSNARLEASDNRIKVTIRMAYGFHHVDNLTALITLRCGGLDIRLPQPTI